MAVRKGLVPVLALCVVVVGCATKKPPQVIPPYDQFRNTIVPAPVPTKGPIDFNASLLPRGARGKFSSFDGDAFVVHFPPRVSGELTSQEVFAETIRPLVTAMGYGSRAGDLTAGA